MANLNDTYFTLTGLAYINGLDSFDEVMTRERVLNLFNACLETKGFKWVELNFINWIICIAGRELRKRPVLNTPDCVSGCKYRMKYEQLGSQTNALRVEIIPPSDRCGWNLKDGRMGGRPDDYYPCTLSN